MTSHSIELLAPARDAECGIAAIDHGADAVYIGADRFGARTAAANPIADIARLCAHARLFHAKVYLTLNTILYDKELSAARDLIAMAWDAGISGVIFQDMALLEMDLPPVPLHASTQMHNVDPAHIRFLEAAGVSRVVLARELDLRAIRTIRETSGIALEAFVHGALCVSDSGRCWMSAAMGGRSANRGACGQPCRLDWEVQDETGAIRGHRRHFLSLKDMNRSAHLEEMMDAGVTSFKIEGRLKDIAYVKNVTAYYRQALDAIFERRPAYCRAACGEVTHGFTPDPQKTFHRGATDYFITGKRSDIWNFDTPKAIGEALGEVGSVEKNFFTLKTAADLSNGDGICFFDRYKKLHGMQINRITDTRIFPAGSHNLRTSALKPGTRIFRNHDHRFKKRLEKPSSERKIPVWVRFSETRDGFLLEMTDAAGNHAAVEESFERIFADHPESVIPLIRRQMAKLGDSPFVAKEILVDTSPWYFRPAALNRMRRRAVEALCLRLMESAPRPLRNLPEPGFATRPYPAKEIDATFNVANRLSAQFYKKHGAGLVAEAFELGGADHPDHPLMTTKHCLRYALGACPKHHDAKDASDWFLSRKDKRFCLRFDCRVCRMQILQSGNP